METVVPQKRKRSVLTFEKNLKIVRGVEKGTSQRNVAEKSDFDKSTVADIWKDRNKLSACIEASESSTDAKKRCITREAKFVKIDEAC